MTFLWLEPVADCRRTGHKCSQAVAASCRRVQSRRTAPETTPAAPPEKRVFSTRAKLRGRCHRWAQIWMREGPCRTHYSARYALHLRATRLATSCNFSKAILQRARSRRCDHAVNMYENHRSGSCCPTVQKGATVGLSLRVLRRDVAVE